MRFFDAHCHLQLSQYGADRDAVIARMRESGTGGIVVGVDYQTSRAGLELARAHDFLWAAVGLHPNDNPTEVFDAETLAALAGDPKVVAIGECGLDYFRSGGTPEEKAAQKERFEQQIKLALALHKTLIIHCRNAHEDMLEILLSYSQEFKNKNVPVIIHFFTGSAELAKTYLDLGCYLSFPGPVTYTDMYDDSIRLTPLERVLSETDAPFAAPVPYRGKRNEPAYVSEVVRKIAAVKGVDAEEAGAAVVQNAKKAFELR